MSSVASCQLSLLRNVYLNFIGSYVMIAVPQTVSFVLTMHDVECRSAEGKGCREESRCASSNRERRRCKP